jgi:peptidyl-prolyl cis-trans isomerase B (cyclophilin B)
MGNMTAVLYDATPQHRDNFVKLANEGYYDGLLFHRIMQSFMIQGGDPDSRGAESGQPLGRGGPGYTVPAEFNPGLVHRKGALAAARQPDQVNPERASSGSQFYIVQGRIYPPEELANMQSQFNMAFSEAQVDAYTSVGGTPQLDGAYTVFGEVIEGLEVLDKLAAVGTDPRDRPLEDIPMKVQVLN